MNKLVSTFKYAMLVLNELLNIHFGISILLDNFIIET